MSDHTEVATCQRTGCCRPLVGQQQRYCSDACRVDHWNERKYSGRTAEDLLAALPQKELRAVIRRVCERRWPGLRGRISVRFGKPWMPHGGPGPRH